MVSIIGAGAACEWQRPAGRGLPGAESLPAAALDTGGVEAQREPVRVRRTIDGDTVELADGRTVRCLGIDAPESGAAGYREARTAIRRIVEGGRWELVTFAAEDRDRHGRVLGLLLPQRGAPGGPAGDGGAGVAGSEGSEEPRLEEPDELGGAVGVALVRRGRARVYLKDPDHLPERLLRALRAAQTEAVAERRGIWKRLDDLRWPRGGFRSTRLRLHEPLCRHIRGVRTRPIEDLAALEAALAAGKSPCRTCQPLAAP